MARTFPCSVALVLVILGGTSLEVFAKSTSHRNKRQLSDLGSADQEGCKIPNRMDNGRFSPSGQRCPPYVSNPACRMVPGTLVQNNWELYYSCDSGYVINTTGTASVCKDGQWMPALPACVVSEKFCSSLQFLDLNVKCSYHDEEVSCKRQMKPGTIAKPECKPGYKPAYQPDYKQLTCLYNGHWDNPLFYCVTDRLCPPLSARGMDVKCELEGKDVSCDYHMQPGTVATPQCRHNYRPAYDPGYKQLTCLDNGHWDQSLYYCTAECGESKLDFALRPLIVDGEEAQVGAFPWHAGLYYRGQKDGKMVWEQGCGGSLITDQIVLTAAHCVTEHNQSDIRVALGKFYRSWDRQETTEAKRNVLKILYPRDYYKHILLYDIAILLLDKKIEFGEFIMPVCHGFLDGASFISNTIVFIVGWGKTEDTINGQSSEKLLYNNVTVVSNKICLRNVPSQFPSFEKFCIGKNNQSGSVALPGDSGGGLTAVHDGLHYLFGMTSLKSKEFSMYTNITWPANMIWIENQMRKYYPNFNWVDNYPTSSDKISRGCVLPETSASRIFCKQSEGCEDCDIYSTRCFVPPGSEVDRVKVVCAPGYGLATLYRGGDVALCLPDGSWYPQIPECLSTGNESTYAPRNTFIPGYPWQKVTWQEAKENCEKKGYQLATVKSPAEQEWFEVTAATQFRDTYTKPNNIWMGLKVQTVYKWVDGSVLGVKDGPRWLPGQPDNAGGQEHCVQVVVGIGLSPTWRKEKPYQLNDNTCSESFYYWCEEIDAQPIESNSTLTPTKRYIPGSPWRQVTWHEARDNCRAKGNQLATIKTVDQQKLFEEEADKYFRETGTKPSNIWIGLRYDRSYKWVDGSVFNTSKTEASPWLPNEPNNQSGEENCVISVVGVGFDARWSNGKPYQWNDDTCSKKKYYFCEDLRIDSAGKATIEYIPGDPWAKVGWEKARNNCMAKGYKLPLIKTPDQQELFEEAVRKNFRKTETVPANVWIGLRDERRFEWVDKSYLEDNKGNLSPWMPNQPDNAENQENCVEAVPAESYKWNDLICSAKNHYFCIETASNENKSGLGSGSTSTKGYKYVPGFPWKEVTWEQARDNCRDKGYQLATIKNTDQWKSFKDAISDKFSDMDSEPNTVWVGLRDERRFEWLDGLALGASEGEVTPWLPNEPNNAGGNERCVQAVAGNDLTPKWPNGKPYQWNDDVCSLKNYYFCKERAYDQLGKVA